MGIGIGIFLIAVGAILTFAVHATVVGLDLKVIGWILMLSGVAGLIFFIYFWNRRRPTGAVPQQPRGYDDTGQPPL
jgi:Na+/proline symporter